MPTSSTQTVFVRYIEIQERTKLMRVEVPADWTAEDLEARFAQILDSDEETGIDAEVSEEVETVGRRFVQGWLAQ
jgi:hypothetical protein